VSQALVDRALVALRDLLAVGCEDRLLVVDDGTLSPRLIAAFTAAAGSIGAETVVVSYRPRRFLSMKQYGLFARASLESDAPLMPRALGHAMAGSDVIVILNSDIEILFDPRFRELASSSRRIAWIAYLDEESFLRLLPEGIDEADRLHAFTHRVAASLRRTREVRIESAAGTSLRLEIGAHAVNAGTWYGPGGRGSPGVMFWPGGQVATVPNASTAEGVLVIDRSVSAPEFRPLREPIRFTVERGYVVSLEGGHEARLMESFLAGLDDGGEAYHVTELGVGTSSRCRMTGVAGPCEDTHTLGCVSLALGADVHIGGTTRAGCHIDMTMSAATLIADGCPLVEAGEFPAGAPGELVPA
jgi:hypothetical protein